MPLLLRAEYLVCDPERLAAGVIKDGALVVEDGRIIAAGPWSELHVDYENLTPVGGPHDWLAIPGLVNAHHHGRGVSTLMTGVPDGPLELWIPSLILYPSLDVYWNTFYDAACMLRAGITTSLQSHSSSGPLPNYRHSVEAALAAYADAGMRVTFALGQLDQQYLAYLQDSEFIARLPASMRDELKERFNLADQYISTDDYFRLFEELRAQMGSRYPHAQLILSPCGVQWASEELLRRMVNVARVDQTGIHLHLVETIYQRLYLRRRFNASAIQVLERFGMLGPHVSLAHAVWLTEADLDHLAGTGTTVVTNASSNLRLGSGILPLQALRDRGINVAVGIDNNGLNDDEDIFKEMRLLGALHRTPGLYSRWLSPYDVLCMATVGGARAALLDGKVGRLLPGYRADVTILDLRRIRTPYVHPRSDLVALALERAQLQDVGMVMVEGAIQWRGGQFTHFDLAEAERRLNECGRTLESPSQRETQNFLDRLKPFFFQVYQGWEPSEYHPYYNVNSRAE
jgi:5-methylthioadenosine/S-adenosylhomocysteine deaminase